MGSFPRRSRHQNEVILNYHTPCKKTGKEIVGRNPKGLGRRVADKKTLQMISENIGGQMGGYGSGRQGWKPKAEHMQRLNVDKLHKSGDLQAGNFGTWQWSRYGEVYARVSWRADTAALMLDFGFTPYGDETRQISQHIPIVRQPCHFGNFRLYFNCPANRSGRACNRRAVNLYFRGGYFLCRHCQRVAYASQSEGALDRALRAADKRRAAIKADPGFESIAPKPKGMHWATYWRHMDVIDTADDLANRAFIAFAHDKFSRALGDLLD